MNDNLLHDVASHCMVGLDGVRLGAGERRLLGEFPPAGVILFSRNVSDAKQLHGLTEEVRGIVTEASGYYPFIAADHEGGRISVLSRAIGVPPTQLAVAKADDAALCRRLYRDTARLMSACGVNMALSPLADINSEYLNPVIGDRAFGEDRDEVASLVVESLRGFHEGGIHTCIKHFPGHGSTASDSHVTRAVLELTTSQLRESALVPFAAGIEAGAKAVMVGHVEARDRRLPASLDPEMVGGVLRGELGFEGLVMTDALEMAGVGERSPAEIMKLALAAGCEILLFSRPVEEVYADLEAEFSDVDTAEDREFWLDRLSGISMASLDKMEQYRTELYHGTDRARALGRLDAGRADRTDSEMFEELMEQCAAAYRETAARSVCVVRDPASVLPLRSRGVKYLTFCGESADFGNHVVQRALDYILAGYFSPSGGHRGDGREIARRSLPGRVNLLLGRLRSSMKCRIRETGDVINLMEINVQGETADGVGLLVMLNRRPCTKEVLSHLCSHYDAVIVAGWPYAAHFIPEDKAVIVTHGIYDAAFDAAWDVS